MSQSRFNDDLTPLSPGQRVSEALSAGRFNALAELASGAAMGKQIRGGPGVRIKSGAHGVTVSVNGRGKMGRGQGSRPFYLHSNGAVEIGTVNGSLIPVIDTVEIGRDGPTLDFPNTGSGYAYLKAVATLTFQYSFLSAWVLSGDIEVVCNATPLSDAVTGAGEILTAYKLLGETFDGKVVRPQAVLTNQNFTVCPSGTSAVAVWSGAGA